MGAVKLQRTEMVAQDSTPVRLVYDEEADILEIFFGENGPATGLELTASIVLRLDRKAKRILSVMLRHFSIPSDRTATPVPQARHCPKRSCTDHPQAFSRPDG